MTEQIHQNVFIFDIDGVVTDVEEKRVKEEGIIDVIVSDLEKDTPVIFITGRSLDWVGKTVLPFIERGITHRDRLDNLLVVGEFGGDWIYFQNGEEKQEVESIRLPQDLIDQATEATDEYSDVMFTDHTKKTQFTSEVRENVDL